jgi:hypothetical protein
MSDTLNLAHCIKCGKPTVYYWGNPLAGYGPSPEEGAIDNRPKEKMGCASCGKKWNTLTGKEER